MASSPKRLIVCQPKALPEHQRYPAAMRAIAENPLNHVAVERMSTLGISAPPKAFIAAAVTKYWRSSGVRLTVGFLDNPSTALRNRLLSHMNAWNREANVSFVETASDAEVRVTRIPGGQHWSYVGTDILLAASGDATMNLDGFTMDTPDGEFYRVVRHETGHTLGFVHEHMRQALVDRIDVAKALKYYEVTQGWSEAEVRAQVLTPLEESSLVGTDADADSIMSYQIEPALTIDGEGIAGGLDIDDQDYRFAGRLYPKADRVDALRAIKPREPHGDLPIIIVADADPAFLAALVSAVRGG